MRQINNLKLKSVKGFTLIEVLIATFIFSMVMVITTSAVGQGVNYQSKLEAVRKTSIESRKISDLLSRDIREANDDFKISYLDNSVDEVLNFSRGTATFSCDGVTCEQQTFRSKDDVVSGDQSSFNTLVLVNKDKVKIYYFPYGASRTVHYFEYNRSSLSDLGIITEPVSSNLLNLNGVIKQAIDDHSAGLISGDVSSWSETPDSAFEIKTKVTMWGYNPYLGDIANPTNRQPYIGFNVTSELGNSTSATQDHAISSIETMVSSRSYN